MDTDRRIALYRRLYTRLLRFYPNTFRKRFGEGMSQTFNDLCRERIESGDALLPFALRTYLETSLGIVKVKSSATGVQARGILRIALVTALILLVPLVAMLVTDEVVWGPGDFMVAGLLLFGAGLAYYAASRKAGNTVHRAAFGLAVGAGLLLVWVNLAVGLIGSEENPANLMYLGVLAVGFIGAVMARFRARGMARVLFITALAQALVPLIALVVWPSTAPLVAFVRILFLNAVFVLLFAGSALLFRRA